MTTAQQREIRFRAWDGKKMYYLESTDQEHNHYLQFGRDGFWLNHSADGRLITCTKDGGVIMQFIGMQDMDAKPIYEGDILTGYRRGSNTDLGYTGYVFWQDQQAGWMIKCGKYNMEILSLAQSGWAGENGKPNITQLDSFQVIGNIYQNPELLS